MPKKKRGNSGEGKKTAEAQAGGKFSSSPSKKNRKKTPNPAAEIKEHER